MSGIFVMQLPNLNRALQLVMELMSIPGKSGQEKQVAEFICKTLTAAGVPSDCIRFDEAHRRALIAGEVGNLIVKLPGTIRGPRRLLTAHMDTVPICVGAQPTRVNGYIQSANPATGVGADNRAGCAAILNALLEIYEHQLNHPPLTICWFIQEEIGLQGSRLMKKNLLGQPKLAFNWDGGGPTKLTVGATGGYRMEIEVTGVASHAGVAPEQGVSAIAIASLAIADLQRGGWHGDVNKGKKHGTSNIGFIVGGEATNVVTDRVKLKAEARSHDAKFRQQIIREMERCFTRAAKEVRNAMGKHGAVNIEGRLDYESFLLADDEPCVMAAEQAIRAAGLEPYRAITNGGLDANWITSHGIPTVTLGCGQVNPHMSTEKLDIENFETACRVALSLATATERENS
jgi:tripeptide aminopeptidase